MSFERFQTARRASALCSAATRAGVNETDLEKRTRAEAQGAAVWARRTGAGDAGLEIDVAAACAAGFALSTIAAESEFVQFDAETPDDFLFDSDPENAPVKPRRKRARKKRSAK